MILGTIAAVFSAPLSVVVAFASAKLIRAGALGQSDWDRVRASAIVHASGAIAVALVLTGIVGLPVAVARTPRPRHGDRLWVRRRDRRRDALPAARSEWIPPHRLSRPSRRVVRDGVGHRLLADWSIDADRFSNDRSRGRSVTSAHPLES